MYIIQNVQWQEIADPFARLLFVLCLATLLSLSSFLTIFQSVSFARNDASFRIQLYRL